MICEQWANDIYRALKEFDIEINQDITLSANNALFALTQSYVWRDEFKGFHFNKSNEDKNIGWIGFDAVYEPFSKRKLDLHHEGLLDMFKYRYEYQEYYDEDGEEVIQEPWEKPYKHDATRLEESVNDSLSSRILEKLSTYSEHYAMLLEKDPVKQAEHLSSLDEMEYLFVEKGNDQFREINQHNKMSDFNSGEMTALFGHRYYESNYSDNRSYIIAKNPLGVMGMACLFDYGDSEGDYKWSLSFVSVSPSYRGQGIAKEMLNKVLDLAYEEGRFLTRTEPSDIGEEVLHNAYTRYGQEHPKKVPFVEPGLGDCAYRIAKSKEWRSLPKEERFKAMNGILNAIRNNLTEDSNLMRRSGISWDDTEMASRKLKKGIKVLESQKAPLLKPLTPFD